MSPCVLFSRLTAAIVALAWLLSPFVPQARLLAQVQRNERTPAEASDSPLYRRIFVPADHPESWPTDGARYVPLAREEFTRRIDSLNDRRQRRTIPGAQLSAAHYRVKLTAQGALDGNASLQVRLHDKRAAFLPLDPFNLVLRKARWNTASKDKDIEPVDALIGAWPQGSAEKMAYGVWAAQEGTLDFEFALSPSQRSPEQDEYLLELPTATSQSITLTLPAGFSARISPSAIVDRSAPVGEQRQVTFRLSPAPRYHLFIIKKEPSIQSSSSRPLVSIAESYAVSQDGVNYEAELRTVLRGVPLQQLRLDVPDSLRITHIQVDGVSTEWRRETNNAGLISVPLPRSNGPQIVAIKGACRVVLDAPWQLPRVTAPDASWTEGSVSVSVDQSLVVQSIDPRGSSLLNVVGVSAGVSQGEAYRLQSWSEEATTEVTLSKRTPTLKGTCGVITELRDHEMVGRARATLWADGGSILQLSASLAGEWLIDSVEAAGPDDVIEWHVARQDDRCRLYIQLRLTPSEAKPITLTCLGRRLLRDAAKSMTLDQANWIRFENAAFSAHYLFVNEQNPAQLLAANAARQPGNVSAEGVPSELRDFFGDSSDGLIFNLENLAKNSTVRLGASRPRVHGQAWIQLIANPAGFSHSVDIRCEPLSEPVNDLRVETSRPLPSTARWRLGSSEVSVEREEVPGETSSIGSSFKGARYRVRLPNARHDPFDLHVQWQNPSTNDAVIDFRLADAEGWQSFAVLGGDEHSVKVDAHGCSPAPMKDANRPSEAPVLGCFRLLNDASSEFGPTPSLTLIELNEPQPAESIVCWQCNLSTLQFSDGNQVHRIIYDLDALGSQQVALTAPSDVAIDAVHIDGVETPIDLDRPTGRLTLRLPAGRRHISLQLNLHRLGPALGLTAEIQPPRVETTFPILGGQWTVATPPEYGFLASGAETVPLRQNWFQRLCGSLARQSGTDAEPRSRQAYASSIPNLLEKNPTAKLRVPANWTEVTQQFVSEPSPLRLRSESTERATWWVVWLAAAGVAGHQWGRRSKMVWILILGAAIGTQLLPLAWAFFPQAMLIGLVSGLAVRLFFSVIHGDTIPQGVRTLVLSSVALVLATPALAVEGPPAPPDVLFPVAADGKPAAADVYVSEPLLKTLLAAEDSNEAPRAGFVLLAANYEVNLAAIADGSKYTSKDCTLKFRVETFNPDQEVQLPLAKHDGQWREDAKLDGAPIALRWNSTGRGCALTCPEPGRHLLIIHVLPATTTKNGVSNLHLSAPKMPGATVEVIKPESLTGVAIQPQAYESGESNAGRLKAILAPSSELSVAWNASKRSQAKVEYDQLSVLTIEPGAARLTATIQLRSEDTAPQTLTLLTAPQLKLLPPDPSLPFSVTEASTDSGNRLELAFREPPASVATVELQFQVQRNTPVGHLEFPSVRVIGSALRSNHFALAAAPGLRVSEEVVSGLSPVPPADIQRAWPRVTDALKLAYSVTSNQPTWSAQVEPSPLKSSCTESLTVHCQAREAACQYRAVVDRLDGELFIHRLNVPADLVVKGVSVVTKGSETETPLRYSRPRPDLLCVFLSRPLTSPHLLTVSGAQQYDADRRLSVLRWGLASGGAPALQVSVTRDHDVNVEVANVAEPRSFESTPEDVAALPVAEFWIADSQERQPELIVSENKVRLSAVSATAISDLNTEPVATYAVQAKILRGTLDRIRLNASTNWRQPELESPGASVSFVNNEDAANRQEIDVQLDRTFSAGETVLIRLRGRLETDANRHLRFPDIELLNYADEERYLIVPGSSHEWQPLGVQPAKVPPAVASELEIDEDSPAFRVTDSPFSLEWRSLPKGMQHPRIRLVTTRATLGVAEWSAVSEWIVAPAGLAQFKIRVPDQATLLYAALDDQPIAASNQEVDWRTPEGSPYLPRLVTVAYRSSLPSDGSLRLELPQIIGSGRPLATERSLWSIVSNQPIGVSLAGPGRISADELKAASRQARLAAVTEAAPLVLAMEAGDAGQWFVPWLHRLDTPAGKHPDAKDALESNWQKLREQLESTPSAKEQQTSQAKSPRPALVSDDAICFETTGHELQVEPVVGGSMGRWLAAGLLILLGGVCSVRPRTVSLADGVLKTHPHLILVAVGLLWWIALRPRFVGLAIVLFSIAAYIKKRRMASRAVPQRRESNPSLSSN